LRCHLFAFFVLFACLLYQPPYSSDERPVVSVRRSNAAMGPPSEAGKGLVTPPRVQHPPGTMFVKGERGGVCLLLISLFPGLCALVLACVVILIIKIKIHSFT
jgi:hypothetical protein